MNPKVIRTLELKKGKEINLHRKHPWIFSGALMDDLQTADDGELVYVCDYRKNRLGYGHFHNGSIAIKMLEFGNVDYTNEFWIHRLSHAMNLRKQLSFDQSNTNCFRWIHGEGDGLPGLIIDVYDHNVVIQCHTIGMHKQILQIANAIQSVYEGEDLCIIDRSKESLPPDYANKIQNVALSGNYNLAVVNENGFRFSVDCLKGQKTGFFLDQRENRKLLTKYVAGKNILNAFSYSGGFSIYALANNSTHVDSVDVSKSALALLQQNILLNGLDNCSHHAQCIDVNDYLRNMESRFYNLIILDPPAFAKSISKKHAAVQAYKRINSIALKKLSSNGILFTFSCSQVIDEELFYNTIVAAGIESGKTIKVLHKLSQAPDHPVSLFHPEGRYLKGLVLFVSD